MQAVAYLYQFSQYQIEAVHFSIVLRYYGLLRIPESVHASEGNICSSPFLFRIPPLGFTDARIDADECDSTVIVDPSSTLPSLNFSRLLHRYTRAFVLFDPTEALNYIYLICLNATTPTSSNHTTNGRESSSRAGKGKEGEGMEGQVGICHDYIREVVMDTRRYTDLLGDVRNDGTKIVSSPLPPLSLSCKLTRCNAAIARNAGARSRAHQYPRRENLSQLDRQRSGLTSRPRETLLRFYTTLQSRRGIRCRRSRARGRIRSITR